MGLTKPNSLLPNQHGTMLGINIMPIDQSSNINGHNFWTKSSIWLIFVFNHIFIEFWFHWYLAGLTKPNCSSPKGQGTMLDFTWEQQKSKGQSLWEKGNLHLSLIDQRLFYHHHGMNYILTDEASHNKVLLHWQNIIKNDDWNMSVCVGIPPFI